MSIRKPYRHPTTPAPTISPTDSGLAAPIAVDLVVPAERVADHILAAQHRRNTLQTEAAINLAIGYVMETLSPGVEAIVISPSALAKFNKKFRVEVTWNEHDNSHTYRLVERT